MFKEELLKIVRGNNESKKKILRLFSKYNVLSTIKDLSDDIDHIVDTAEKVVDEIKEGIGDIVDEVKESVSDIKETITDTVDDIKEIISNKDE